VHQGHDVGLVFRQPEDMLPGPFVYEEGFVHPAGEDLKIQAQQTQQFLPPGRGGGENQGVAESKSHYTRGNLSVR